MKPMLKRISFKKQKGFSFHEKNSSSKSGFTLIELLVVIAIIIILISIGASSYTTSLRRGRDAQRKADLKKIQSGLQSFYSDHNAYPDESDTNDSITCHSDGSLTTADPTGTPSPPSPTQTIGGSGIPWGNAFVCGNGSGSPNTYLSQLPKDPLSGQKYIYEVVEVTYPSQTPLWCRDPFHNTVGGYCQHYTIWAKLENKQDPDKYVLGQDATCDLVIHPKSGISHDSGWYTASDAWVCVHD